MRISSSELDLYMLHMSWQLDTRAWHDDHRFRY